MDGKGSCVLQESCYKCANLSALLFPSVRVSLRKRDLEREFVIVVSRNANVLNRIFWNISAFIWLYIICIVLFFPLYHYINTTISICLKKPNRLVIKGVLYIKIRIIQIKSEKATLRLQKVRIFEWNSILQTTLTIYLKHQNRGIDFNNYFLGLGQDLVNWAILRSFLSWWRSSSWRYVIVSWILMSLPGYPKLWIAICLYRETITS